MSGNRDKVIDSIPVMYVKAKGGTAGAKDAFDVLESKLPTRRGRRFYGAFFYEANDYRACVEKIEGEDAKAMSLEDWVIPGGRYATTKVTNWNSKLPQLTDIFMKLGSDRKVDETRPSVEYYRSMTELILYFPVKDVGDSVP
jgi:hypothetical protein